MNFEVFVTNEAEKDILDIYDYIAANESIRKADKIFENLKHACLNLSRYPDRGHIPPELERINLLNFKEIHYKPYRIIYEIIEKQVFIHCIFDGRRDLQEVLEFRLLRL
jgi:toxin ParE1/3/4